MQVWKGWSRVTCWSHWYHDKGSTTSINLYLWFITTQLWLSVICYLNSPDLFHHRRPLSTPTPPPLHYIVHRGRVGVGVGYLWFYRSYRHGYFMCTTKEFIRTIYSLVRLSKIGYISLALTYMLGVPHGNYYDVHMTRGYLQQEKPPAKISTLFEWSGNRGTLEHCHDYVNRHDVSFCLAIFRRLTGTYQIRAHVVADFVTL